MVYMAEEVSGSDSQVATVTPSELDEQITAGDEIVILDTRSEDEFDTWHIQGDTVEIINYPYFRLLDGIPEDLLAELPTSRTVTVVCAKGGASEMVAGQLEDEGYAVNHLERGMNGWAEIYESAELPTESSATVTQYQRPSSGCLAYLVVSGDEAVVIDPLRAFSDVYVQDAEAAGAEIVHAIDTHIHADHISGTRTVADETGATVTLPQVAADRGFEYDGPYQTLTDGDSVAVGDVAIGAVSMPGHTSGMTAYTLGDTLFTGDGLFVESVARPDLEDQDAAREAAETLHNSLTAVVASQPGETVIAPGHFSGAADPTDDGTYMTTLEELQDTMNALSMATDRFVEYVLADMPPQPTNYQEIIATNLGHQSPTDREAFELELGPNNCAAGADTQGA